MWNFYSFFTMSVCPPVSLRSCCQTTLVRVVLSSCIMMSQPHSDPYWQSSPMKCLADSSWKGGSSVVFIKHKVPIVCGIRFSPRPLSRKFFLVFSTIIIVSSFVHSKQLVQYSIQYSIQCSYMYVDSNHSCHILHYPIPQNYWSV